MVVMKPLVLRCETGHEIPSIHVGTDRLMGSVEPGGAVEIPRERVQKEYRFERFRFARLFGFPNNSISACLLLACDCEELTV